ncbi:MAG: hypothetical protein PHQ23_13735, partial [Candidatus Wallbacteria bacterium]|nr:hypothetical protein [Candidatus Wallbacteria bacterium]
MRGFKGVFMDKHRAMPVNGHVCVGADHDPPLQVADLPLRNIILAIMLAWFLVGADPCISPCSLCPPIFASEPIESRLSQYSSLFSEYVSLERQGLH